MTDPEHRLAAIVLAAGFSSRFGEENKLHARLEGRCVVERVIKNIACSSFEQLIVVSAPSDDVLEGLSKVHRATTAVNDHPENGIGSSISKGISSLGCKELSGAAIFLGDMPFINIKTIEMVVAEFIKCGSDRIVRPSFSGQPGHPVIFPQRYFQKLKELAGDKGAGEIVRQHLDETSLIIVKDQGVVRDIDYRSDLQCLAAAHRRPWTA